MTDIGDVYKERLGYVSFENFEKEIGNNFDKIKEARNDALHGDVLAPEDSYRALIHLLKRIKY
jgi:hypothetical protein